MPHQQDAAFSGSVPENYDQYLGPAFFEPYAADLVERVPWRDSVSILEIACGTGVVTRRLLERLPRDAKLVATDLNDGMISYAQDKLRGADRVEWKQADAMALPFADEAFDVAVCQFGFMFVPEKATAFREARRVLKPGGTFLFNVWDSMETNDYARVAHQTILSSVTPEPPRFFETPYGSFDRDEMRQLLEDAGFSNIDVTTVDLESVSPSARDAARGLVQGTPVFVALVKRDPAIVPSLVENVAQALVPVCGDQPCRGQMRAFVWRATR
jgi:ubiquinone/menaquinone biosynthesis C-methylase UbiE